MKQLTIAAFVAFGALQVHAQNFSIMERGTVEMERQKESLEIEFTAGDVHYFVTKYYSSPTYRQEMQSVNTDGSEFQTSQLEVPVGEFKDSYSINNAVGLGANAFAIVENYNGEDKVRTLTARSLDPDGTVAEEGVDLVSVEFEKMMRSGRLMSTTSPDGKLLVAVAVLPFDKKAPRKVKVAVFNDKLSKVSVGEFEFDGLAIKNARVEAVIGNDGSVYINEYSSRIKEGVKIVVHKYDGMSGTMKESFEVIAEEGYVLDDYMYATNAKGELVIAGACREDRSLTTGDPETAAMFIFKTEGSTGASFKNNLFDAPAENFRITDILFSEETIFVTGEEAKEDKSSPAETTPTTANSTFTYTHEEEYIFGFNPSGEKVFELILDQQLSATNYDQTLRSASHIIGGKLVYIYNDQFTKHRTPSDIAGSGTIPIAVTVTPNGLMTPLTPFVNDLKLDNGFTLMPAYSLSNGNTISLLSRDGSRVRLVQIHLE